MGLDCYGYVRKKDKSEEPEYFWYARKNRWIQNWMESKWRISNTDETKPFNCVNFYMTNELLDELEKVVKDGSISEYGQAGFFFGSWELDKDDKELILSFVTQAKELLNQDKLVSYYSWW